MTSWENGLAVCCGAAAAATAVDIADDTPKFL